MRHRVAGRLLAALGGAFFSPLRSRYVSTWRTSLRASCRFLAIPTVVSLSLGICPPAIVWAITGIHINPIDGMSARGAWSHILKKVQKRLAPTFAHGNAPAAIVWVILAIRVVAAALHSLPRQMFRRSAFPMCPAHHSSGCASHASTTDNNAVNKVVGNKGRGVSAVAPGNPHLLSLSAISGAADNGQASESSPSQIRGSGTPATFGCSCGERKAFYGAFGSAFTSTPPMSAVSASVMFSDNNPASEPLACHVDHASLRFLGLLGALHLPEGRECGVHLVEPFAEIEQFRVIGWIRDRWGCGAWQRGTVRDNKAKRHGASSEADRNLPYTSAGRIGGYVVDACLGLWARSRALAARLVFGHVPKQGLTSRTHADGRLHRHPFFPASLALQLWQLNRKQDNTIRPYFLVRCQGAY